MFAETIDQETIDQEMMDQEQPRFARLVRSGEQQRFGTGSTASAGERR